MDPDKSAPPTISDAAGTSPPAVVRRARARRDIAARIGVSPSN